MGGVQNLKGKFDGVEMGGKDRTTEMPNNVVERTMVHESLALLRGLNSMSGRDVLNTVLDRENPHELVQALSSEDFYWLMKKIGEDDCLPLMAIASEEQWQFVLDLEVWAEDRLDPSKTFQWISRFQKADLMRVARWIFGEGQALGYLYLFRHVEIVARTEEDSLPDLPEGFVTLDGVFYFRAVDRSQSSEFETLLRAMAAEDDLRYQAMLVGLSGLLPAEAEEEMYRMRGVRLAEHGFLPREEALSIYSPLPVSAAVRGAREGHLAGDPGPEFLREGALAPLMLAPAGEGIFSQLAFSLDDPVLLDRINLEFSGLCNLIMSADRVIPEDLNDLERICRKAAGYVNVALESLCGGNLSRAMAQTRDTALLTLFRIGVGLALDVGKRAVRWCSSSWWSACGLEHGFWGEVRGKFLQGLLQPRPLYYSGVKENEEFRDFRSITELRQSELELEKIVVLDDLFRKLEASSEQVRRVNDVTAQAVLMTLWAREQLDLEREFSPLSLSEARRLFAILKGGFSRRNWLRKDFRSRFIDFYTDGETEGEHESDQNLRRTLSEIWDEFREEYREIRALDLDARFSRLLVIEPSREVAPE